MNVKWQASWIWNELPENTPNVYIEARKKMNLQGAIRRARLYISANQEYEVYMNGTVVGRGPSPSDQAWKYFDTYDVEAMLHSGVNSLSVLAYNFGNTDIVIGQFQGPGGLIAQLEVETEHGTIVIATDESWKIRRSPRWVEEVSRQHLWGGYNEIYLAQREDGWEQTDYDDTSWGHAVQIATAEQQDSPWPRLMAREIPFLHREKVCPSAVVRTDMNFGIIEGESALLRGGAGFESMKADASLPGSLPGVVYDFEREIVGYPELTIEAPEGGVVQCSYGESLHMKLYDTFILKKGSNTLKAFGRRAFRFMYITFQATPAAVEVKSVEIESVHYPFGPAGTFECSDELLNRIWDVGLYNTVVNSQDHIEDCPLREKALWVADAVVMAKIIYHIFGEDKLLRKCLLQGARIQNEDGAIPGTGPEKTNFVLPDFCAHWLYGVHRHWQFTGDRSFLEEAWPAIQRVMDWFKCQEDAEGLFSKADRPGWWCFIDWADYIDRRDRVTAMSCFYYKALHVAASLGEAMGLSELAAEWKLRAERLRQSIRQNMWVPEAKGFADCIGPDGLSPQITAQTNFAAMWCGIMDDEEANAFLSQWFDNSEMPELKGAFFYHIVLETLFERGWGEQALAIIRSYWGEMLARGATTWWETFDPSTPHCTVPSPYQGNTPTYLSDHVPVSFCHGWGGSPTYLLTQQVLGVDVSELGRGIVHLGPVPGDLQYAKGSIPTRYGWIQVEWSRDSNANLSCKATVPKEIVIETLDFPNVTWVIVRV